MQVNNATWRVQLAFSMLATTAIAACGTTYSVPDATDAQEAKAQAIYSQENNPTTAQAGERLSSKQAASQFVRVVNRVEPVAEQVCRQEAAKRGVSMNCDLQIVIDGEAQYRNAFQTYRNKTPVIGFTMPMIMDARNEHELAFVMGHEAGHHIAKHMEKQQQQQAAGALILGMATAYAGAYDPYTPQYKKQQDIENAVYAGAAIGGAAYSQTYELEADVLGTHIALASGYDPVKGARFFARPEPKKLPNGQLSFWGTHPADQKRIATVLATVERINNPAE